MTVFMSLLVLCGFAVLQTYGDEGITIQVDRSNESSDESRMKPSRTPMQAGNMQESYDIVRLCTSIPATYDDIMDMYLSPNNAVKSRDVQMRVMDLKAQSTQLSNSVNAYTQALNESEMNPVRQELLSRNEDLTKALEKLQVTSTEQPPLDTAKKVALVVNDIRPPLIDFQTACLAETKDIVNNMLADLRDSSNNMDEGLLN